MLISDEIKIKFRAKTVIRKIVILIWYNGPKMVRAKDYLLIYYENRNGAEKWFVIKNEENIRDYLNRKKTLKQILLGGPTYLATVNDIDTVKIVERLDRETLIRDYVLPTEDSYFPMEHFSNKGGEEKC